MGIGNALADLEARRDSLRAYVTKLILDEAPTELRADVYDDLDQLEREVAARRAWLRAEAGRLVTEFCGLCAVGAPGHATVWRRALGYAAWGLSVEPTAAETPD